MKENTEITVCKTLTLDEREVEDIVRNHLGPEWNDAIVSIYKEVIPAHETMGALDDIERITCEVKLTTITKT